ncbi:uncharacterized protein LOC105231867 [Bactrocera dorsalis]|uniref:Uncharacterized protein LOC105231867 n=1 Tax=Bactrocera dorsalis TaxID=27457 RepID=A0A6I9VKX2_BACDO|nr:uncharacterized protein LOC105231867 [Bactrocera dorsalis]
MSRFNENALEELEYRRCTWWSSFLENIAERDDGKVYDVNSLDKEFDDDSSNDDADEAEEVEDLEDIEYHQLMNQSTEQEKTTFIMESEEIQDILNSTRPILKEHELKLKKTGLEKVMNTFDSVRIEKEIGRWMRRQHSTHISKTKIQSSSDADSSLSCEDDRYIRSVQKCHHMRKPKYKQCFKKCKNYQTSCCTHGIFVEPKPHKLHNCNCCRYQLNSIKTPKYWKMTSTEEPEIIDKQHGKLTVFSENQNKKHHCTRQDSSSSDSDCNFQRRCFLKRDMTSVRESQNRFLTVATAEEPLLQKEKRNRFTSMVENVYETPTKSKAVKSSIPNTAPSKITTKRTAAQKALSLLTTNKIKNAKPIKSKRVDKTQKNENSSSEYNTTFENDIKKAKALSLKTLKENNDKCISSKSPPCTSSESTNSSLFKLAGSSRNKEVKESASTAKTTKKAERKNKTQSKSMTKQSCLKKFDGKPDEEKENTFLAHSENICNSTALNTAAARKQLPSRVPVVEENIECSPTATPCIENKQHTLRKKATSHLSPIEESSSEATPKMKTQFKNAFSSTVIPGAATAKELIVLSPPVEERVTCTPTKATSKIGVRHAVTEPRRKQRRFMKNNKTMDYRSNISNTTLESAVKANRIMLYTPQRKARSMDGDFQVTKELMSSVVGEKHARRFFKYHIGRLTFPKTSTIYYCPPETELSSSESDEDPLQKAGRCGELHESEQQDDSTTL